MADPSRLPPLLGDLLRRAEASYPDQGHRLWDVWEEALGPAVAGRSYPLSLRSGRLTVAVASAAWMQELSFLREEMRRSLNAALSSDVVREVRLRLATPEPPPPPRRRAEPPPWLAVPLSAEVRAELEAEVAAIPDPELRAAVLRVRTQAERARAFKEARAEP